MEVPPSVRATRQESIFSVKNMKRYFFISLLFLLVCFFTASAQNTSVQNAAEVRHALEKLNILGSVLYIAAHPDDENTGLMAYWAGGKKYRTGYLSLTRGDGGQNLIGTEKGSDIGILRTQELLAARHIDGGEQFFARALDFGYSKTVHESFEFWGYEEALADVVWIIRTFRPDIIVTRFTTEESPGSHGHHPATSILAVDAFTSAGDPSRFPEQLKYVEPWQAKRILLNVSRFGSAAAVEGLPSVDIGVYNPLFGLSYNEMAGRSRSMHRSQGFGTIPASGSQLEYFTLQGGEHFTADIMEGVDTSWRRIPGGEAVGQMIENILNSYKVESPASVLPQLLELKEKMEGLGTAGPGNTTWVKHKIDELVKLIQSCAGIRFEVLAEDYAAAPGENINVSINFIQRTGQSVRLGSVVLPALSHRHEINQDIPDNIMQSIRRSVALPSNYRISQPYWLRHTAGKGSFVVEDQLEVALAENPPALTVEAEVTLFGKNVVFTAPVRYRWLERDEGEKQRPFEVRPPVTADFRQNVMVFHADEEREITVTLRNHAVASKGIIRLEIPDGWQVSPANIPFEFEKRHDETIVTFRVLPSAGVKVADARAVVSIGGVDYSYSLTEIIYPHIDSRVHFPDAILRMVPLEARVANKRIGYIMGSGDYLPEILKDMGYEVVLLEDEMLTAERFSGFDVIVAGIRAYNTRARLRFAQPLLMDFVRNGGIYIVQYNVNTGLQTPDIGPYPFRISRDRIVEEDAELRFLLPAHSLMNTPNVITKDDFDGWVQERGLYFADQWDTRYTPVFAGHDTGEKDLEGSALYGEYGDGVFIYTGLAFFRQLPAGVPGAFRLFQNMLEARQGHP